MADAGNKEASTLSKEEAQRFWLARTALRRYLVAKDELHWRAQNLYKRSDVFVKAVEGLVPMSAPARSRVLTGWMRLQALGSSIGWMSSMERPGESSRARTNGPRSCI